MITSREDAIGYDVGNLDEASHRGNRLRKSGLFPIFAMDWFRRGRCDFIPIQIQ
jgi:hypothetical protein